MIKIILENIRFGTNEIKTSTNRSFRPVERLGGLAPTRPITLKIVNLPITLHIQYNSSSTVVFSGHLRDGETKKMLEELKSRNERMKSQSLTAEDIENIQAEFEQKLVMEKEQPPAGPNTTGLNTDAVSRLQRHCERNTYLALPQYEGMKYGEQQFKYSVTIKKTFEGQVLRSKKEAKQSAAQAALARLTYE